MTLREELAQLEARAIELRRRIGAEKCDVAGHDWRHVGGTSADCVLGVQCVCSVPVHECAICGANDCGDNADRAKTIASCGERDAP